MTKPESDEEWQDLMPDLSFSRTRRRDWTEMALKTFISNEGQGRFHLAQELYVSTAAVRGLR